MNQTRRQVMQLGAATVGLVAAGGLLPATAQAADAPGWHAKLFGAKSLEEIAQILGVSASESGDVAIVGPDIAENGAVVPVGVKSTAAGATAIGIVVKNNPTALVALFNLKDGAEPNLATRIKMAKTSDVYAVALAGGKLLYAKKEIKVTLGGCGG